MAVDLATLRAGGDRRAVVDRTGHTTYTGLAARVEQLAHGLSARGVTADDRIVVVADNDTASVAAVHALWHLGAVALLVHRSSGPADVAFACAAAPGLVVVSPGASALREAAGAHTVTIDELDAAPGPSPLPAPSPVHPDAPRVVLFTSGTTSAPKGVVHSARSLQASGANFAALTDFTSDERFFLVSPVASITGVLQALELAPSMHTTVVLENAWDEDATLDFLVETGGTYYGGTDTVLARLLGRRRGGRGIGVPLRAVSVGGTMLDHAVLDAAEDEFGIRVLRVYGSSEAPTSTGGRPDEPREVRLGDEGLPAPGVELRVDPVTRELEVRGPHLFRGYLDPADDDGAFLDGWFRTGDAAEIVGGRLRIVGRLKEIAIRNGKKISLAEVDDAFRSAVTVIECAAFAVPDPVTGEHVTLAVRPLPNEDIDASTALDAMVAGGLARWKLPEVVVVYDRALPTTATGKVRRAELTESGGEVAWAAPRLRTRTG